MPGAAGVMAQTKLFYTSSPHAPGFTPTALSLETPSFPMVSLLLPFLSFLAVWVSLPASNL